MEIKVKSRLLHFKLPAGTSRGIYTTRQVWYVYVTSEEFPGRVGIGECAPLPDLSCDASPDYEKRLQRFCEIIKENGRLDTEMLRSYPSMLFGFETAFRQLETGSTVLWDTPFSQGKKGIQINGLIWMGSYDRMLEQIQTKITNGYRCIKLKIGAIDFEKELELLRYVRERFSAEDVELRVDANGAFRPDEALYKLQRLSELDLHSIEQPIRAGEWSEMAELVKKTELPIALDEELIGCNEVKRKKELLDAIRPAYIVLKPSLHGGCTGTKEWIELAEERGIQWWITSALESNVGLNAIAQWCATFDNPLPQGLGTGMLFVDNIEMPLEIRRDCLWMKQ